MKYHVKKQRADYMLIRNGTVVTENGIIQADLRVTGEIIAEIAPGLAASSGEQVIDASGKIILPGGVDVHTHMDLDLGDGIRASDDFYTGAGGQRRSSTTWRSGRAAAL
jgi:dihydropyrimidinase